MNDTPDPSAPRLVSRRTVAKTAAWAAPAIVLAAASPARAASSAMSTGVILLHQPSYTTEADALNVAFVTGSLTPTEGGTPADLILSAECTDGFIVLAAPIITDNGTRFSMLVQAADTGADTGTLTISSPNHPGWAPAEAGLKKSAPVVIPTGVPTFVFDDYLFTGVRGGITTVTGKIVVPEGTRLPENIQLVSMRVIKGWELSGDVKIVGDTFSFDVVQNDLNAAFGYFYLIWMGPDVGAQVPVGKIYTSDRYVSQH